MKLPSPPRKNNKASYWVELDKPTKKRWKMFGELRERAEAVARMTSFIAASETYRGVVGRIPGGSAWSSYRRRMRFVHSGSRDNPVFAVQAKADPFTDRNIDSARTILYIRPKKNSFVPVKDEVRVLHRFSPWTLETLPFTPKRNEAVVVTRKVSKRELQRVQAAREKDRPEWHKALEATGVRRTTATQGLSDVKGKAINDLAFEALRLEFGYGGAKSAPHWRPAITEALQYVRRLYTKRGLFSQAMTNPRFATWRKWPPRAESSIKIGELAEFSRFQKRLHIRVG